MKPPTEPWGVTPSPLHHLSPLPQPTYGESRLCHIPFSFSSMSSNKCNIPNKACAPPASFSFKLFLYHFVLLPLTCAFPLPIRLEILFQRLDCLLSRSPSQGSICVHNLREVLIISPPAASQANHNSVTDHVYSFLFYFSDAAVSGQ